MKLTRVNETIEANSFASAVISLLQNSPEWEGTPTELLEELIKIAQIEKFDTGSTIWPKSSTWVTRRLNELEVALWNAGFTYKLEKTAPKRIITFSKVTKNVVNTATLSILMTLRMTAMTAVTTS